MVGITRRFDDFCGTKLFGLSGVDDVFSFIATGELYDVCKTFIQVPPKKNSLVTVLKLRSHS